MPENADGTMKKEPTTVKYYYVHTTGGVIERHIDIITGKQLYSILWFSKRKISRECRRKDDNRTNHCKLLLHRSS